MGKNLIIKGADFSANAVANINSVTDITSQIVTSQNHRQYLHYPTGGNNDQFMYNANALATSRIGTIDVSGYRGRTIILRARVAYVAGAYYIAFASAVNVTLPWSGTTSVSNAITAIERYEGKDGQSYKDYTFTVPQNANYLVFLNRSDNPASAYLVNE